MANHHCHARRCTTPCKPEMLMCLRHWRMVPRELQRAVWATYRPGQCDDKQPSAEWHAAADAAIAAVAERETPLPEAQLIKAAAAFMNDLAAGKCPHCRQPITRRRKIGRCQYAEPCGHRLGQVGGANGQ